MGQNQYTPLSNLPKEDDLKNLIGNLEYKRINTDELPEEIKANGLVSKFNSVILAASGSTETMCYTIVGLRPDEGNTVIDEHPIVVGYNYNDQTQSFGGIIHHGNWDKRTNPLSAEQQEILHKSGLTASFTYKGIPSGGSGSLYDLYENNMLEGISSQFSILLKRKPNE